MGNCKSYSANFKVYKNNTNEQYENLICHFVKQDNLSFCQKAFVIYEFLKRKPECKDECVYYIAQCANRKKVKNALAYLSEEYNIEILNFLLKLFKKMNNEYYNNRSNFYFSSYYNYFLRDESKFANFYEQMSIIQSIYNFVRLKYILENICLHVYFEDSDNSSELYQVNDNVVKKNVHTNEFVKEKSIELFHLNKKLLGNLSTERKKMMYSIKRSFINIEDFCRNDLSCNAFYDFRMANVMCLYILNNNYKIKSILYNIFTILFFINKFVSLYGSEQGDGAEKNDENEHVGGEVCFDDKVKYSLEHRNVYATYLFVCLCLSFDKKIEEDAIYNANVNVNQKGVTFVKCVNEFLDICTYSQKKLNKFFSQENKERKIYHCSVRSIKNAYMNHNLVNSHYICWKRYIKSVLNVGNSNYFIKNNMIVFCFILFENSCTALSRTSSKKSNLDNRGNKSFFEFNRSLFRKGSQVYEEKVTLRRKLWRKVVRSIKFRHSSKKSYYYNADGSANCEENDNYNDNDKDNQSDDKSEAKTTQSLNLELKRTDNVEFDLNNVALFRVDLYHLNLESKDKFEENVQNYVKLYTIERSNNNHRYVSKKIENQADHELVQTVRENIVHIINVLKTMKNKEICYISPANYYDESYGKIKKEKKTFPNGSDTRVESNDNSNRSKSTDKTFKKERGEDTNLMNKNYVHFESPNYINEENSTKHLNESEEGKKGPFGFTTQNELKKPFFIGVHDTFVPFEMDTLILKGTNLNCAQEEVIKKEEKLYNQVASHARSITKGHGHSGKGSGESSEESCHKKEEVLREDDNLKRKKRFSCGKVQNVMSKKREEEIFYMQNSQPEKNTNCAHFGNTYKQEKLLTSLEELTNGKELEPMLKRYSFVDNAKHIKVALNKLSRTMRKNGNVETSRNSPSWKIRPLHEVTRIDNDAKDSKCKNRVEKQRGAEINGKKERVQKDEEEEEEEENEEGNHLRTPTLDVPNYEEEIYQNDKPDCFKIFVQHKPVGEINPFVNHKYVNINFDMFKIHGGRKKLLLSTYVSTDKAIPYKITLNRGEQFEYMMDLLFLHLNYNRLYFVYIPKKYICGSGYPNDSKAKNNPFLNSMCCSCDIVLENLRITPGESLRNSPVDMHVSAYFERTHFVEVILLLLVDMVKTYSKIKKLQCHFDNKCKEFIKSFYHFFVEKIKKGNNIFCKEKKTNILSITSGFLKKTSAKSSNQESVLSNDLNLSSIKRRSLFNERYATGKEDSNVEAKSLIMMNMSSTLHSEPCMSNADVGKNATCGKADNTSASGGNNCSITIAEEGASALSSFHLHKVNVENPLDVGYKYKNIYIKIIDLRLYEFISDYVNYIRENNSYYYLSPYLFVYKFRDLCFLCIPVCNNFYLIFHLFFFHLLNCSNFFNYKISFSRGTNEEEPSKGNYIEHSSNNFLYINNIIRILNVHKNSKTYMKYCSLLKEPQNSNTICQYYKWKKNKIIIDIRNSFSSPYFIRTKSFISFIESTNLHINLKKLYLNKDYMFSLKLDKKNKPPNECYSNANDIIFMFSYYFNIYTYFYGEKNNNPSKELFHYNRYIIIPYFKDVYIGRHNLHIYLKMLEDEHTKETFSDKTCLDGDERSSNEMYDKMQGDDKDLTKGEEEKKAYKYSFIYNLYENYGDIFINYFYHLLNNLILEIVNEIKLNNFLSIRNFLQLLNKYEINFDTFFWVLYDNYVNIYKKYCAHAALVKFFNNNRSETCDFDYLKKIKYNFCNKKKFYVRRILVFSVCVLLAFICKRILEFFVTNLNCPYESVFSVICHFFFSNKKRREPNDNLHLNLLKSIYFNLFLSLSFVLQYIPLNVQYLNLFKIIRKVKKYKIILAFCLNYICGVNLPFYIFHEFQHMPQNLLNEFFSLKREDTSNNPCSHVELSNEKNANECKDTTCYAEKEQIEWVDENADYNIPDDSLPVCRNKKMNKKILKRYRYKAEKKKKWNLVNLMIKIHCNAGPRTFTFHDFTHASDNILTYFSNRNINHLKQSRSTHGDFFSLIYSHFVNFLFAFCQRGNNFGLSELQSGPSVNYSNGEMGDTEMVATSELLNDVTKEVSTFCENPNEYLKEPGVALHSCNNMFSFGLRADFPFFGVHKLMEENIFHVLLNIIETHYSHLLIILPIFMKENFNLLTYDLKVYLINIFFYIFIRTDKYKICDMNNKKRQFTRAGKNGSVKQKQNDTLRVCRRNDMSGETSTKNFFLNIRLDYSTRNYLEIIRREGRYALSDSPNIDEYEYGCRNEAETGNDETEYESENKRETENEAETQTETDTDFDGVNKNAKEHAVFEREEGSIGNMKENIKMILLDNDYNVYLIEFFFKIVLRIIPFFKQKKKNKNPSSEKSTIIYNVKIILNFFRSFQNVILSMRNNFHVFIYYFFIKGYISLILLNTHRALKCFKKVFVLIVFFFGNPINSLNSHPFLVYVTYILYVLTVLSKLNVVNFHEQVKQEEKKMIKDGANGKRPTIQSDSIKNDEQSGSHPRKKKESAEQKEERGEKNMSLGEDNAPPSNAWLKQKYEVWMYLEIIRTIKRNYVKFNNNIYLVPLNYLFINMKKLFKEYLDELKRVQNFQKTDDKDKIDKSLKRKKTSLPKKEKLEDNSILKEINLNDKLEDKSFLININNSFVSLYPTVKNVKVPKAYLKGDIDKSFPSTEDFMKRTNMSEQKPIAYVKNRKKKEIQDVDEVKNMKGDHKTGEQNMEGEVASKLEETAEEQANVRQKKEKKNTHINASDFPRDGFPPEKEEAAKDKCAKSVYARVDKKDTSNLLLYNLIYINKMNRKLNKCNFVSFNFKYDHYKKVISDYSKYYKIILETFKRKLCECYYAYTFGNNENGSLAIGTPSYLKLSPTIGSMGYDKNKRSIKKGTDFWFTNNLQLIPIKVKKMCMNEGMISIIDKKHNLYIGGNNTFFETRNKLNFKGKNTKLKNNEKRKVKNNPRGSNGKIEIDKFFTNLRLKKMKKQEKNFLDYNSSSGDSDILLFGNSSGYNDITNSLKPMFHCEKLIDCYKSVDHKNKSLCNCTMCCTPLNVISDNFSSCESDVCSPFDSEDSDVTYIKVSDVDEINKNMNINMLLKRDTDKSFYVKKRNYYLKKVSIDNFNIYNSILYSSSYANQYLSYVLPNHRSSTKLVNKFFRQISNEHYGERVTNNLKYDPNETVDGEKRNYDDYKYSKKYMKGLKKKNSRGNCKKIAASTKGKSETILLDSNLNNNKFIYNFIHDIKSRVKFIDIYNGADFVISINNFGHVYSWGNNKYGCLGTGDRINRYAPTLINPGHFFLYDFEKLQIHTNYKTEIKIKGSEKINSKCCENILYNSLILETIKKNIYNKNKSSQSTLKESSVKCNDSDGKLGNSSNLLNGNKYKDEDFFTLKTNNIYTSENMFNFENLEVKNVVISVHKIYVPISSIFCGNNHVCAYSNGSIFMWGEQKLGQTSVPFENIYFDSFNKSEFSDSDSNNNCKKKKKENNKNKMSELLSSSVSSSITESYYFNMIDKKKIGNLKNKFNKGKLSFCKKKFSFNVENPIQNSFNITNNEILLNNRKLKLHSNLNSMNNIKRKKINNNLVLVPIQVCIFNLSYRVKKNENNANNKIISMDSIEAKDNCSVENLINLHCNLHDLENDDGNDNNRNINKTSQKKTQPQNGNLKRKNSYIRIFEYLETFIKAEVVNIYMSLFRNDINIYTNIPNNVNINPYIYGMKFYDYNFYDEKYMNVQDYYSETHKRKECTHNSNKKLNVSNGNDCKNKYDDLHKKGNGEKGIDKKDYGNSLNSQKKIDILNVDDPNKFVKLMKENETINPQIYEYIEKEETVCINIKLIIFLFLFVKKKYMTIFLNSILMVSNVSCGEANTVITCFKRSIYDKYYQYIMKNITCSENYKHIESEKMKSKMSTNIPECYLSSASELSDFIYRNDIYDIKNYTSAIVNWGDKSFDEFKLMNSTYSCSDTSRLYRMIEEILAHYMCIYVCGRDTNNNLCVNNINQSVYTFTRITNNFFYYNFNNFLFLYKYNYYLYYIHKNNVHISHDNDTTHIQNNPLTTFKNIFNTFANKENNTDITNSKSQGIFPNQFIIIKKIVCSNTVTCVLDIHNNIYMAGDLKYYFPNYFQHVAYGSSPFIKINLNNTKTIKSISINENNIFLIYDDNSLKILGYNDYIDFFKYNHPVFFTNKHNKKHPYNILTIQNSDFLVKQVHAGNNCAAFVMKKKRGKKIPKKSIKHFN
ncbi:conserved Plasmodium protein, unknown function [Plasmodium knowlesi strain H]|uniref:Uncharacterized protein n=3 Tax=Plasmodium knowlesi TaxID=5850 RepID=A0A1A7VYK7_PLAKH|nr:conserved Plasmodium protein, unknown function [Plasmodium knowlesi strain H]OTN67428.1 Uncharacterized protein PKNOH_S06431500 [Plasmodium knowlesi]CAA9987585.1 conserved Plasmodium protein, unknown function [Plasmodium knowlesi strain H]SBO27020.1 conserved Plasmodium protein, unknown function [Plasmodium knowlesi strain H]SBO29222.1 conserved Plasmodium protein, unknown function [Plasmodium knowlesi strain H]VVS77059.1 conserved Plasmodium protein, unknown function [Plasmodium knowlesi s